MPEFESLRYTKHASEHMSKRKLSRPAVELTLQHGESWLDDDDLWICELDKIRIVVREESGHGVIITAIRMKRGE